MAGGLASAATAACPAWPMTELRTLPRPTCPVCGSVGRVRYDDLADRLFGAPGRWRLRVCQAPACATAWLDPAPHPDDLWLAYREYYTHAADAGKEARALRSGAQQAWAAWQLGYPLPRGASRWQGWLLQLQPARIDRASSARLHLPFVAGGRLLDVGCGAGDQLRRMRAFGWDVSGLEPDAQAVAAAQAAGLDVRHGDLLSLRWPDAAFDAVTMVHVIEHLVDPQRHLLECLRILRPGGRLVVITPNVRSLGHRCFTRDWRGLEPPRHLQLYSPASLRRTLHDAGLEVERLRTRARGSARLLRISAQLRQARRGGQARLAPRTRGAARWLWRIPGGLERLLVALRFPLGEELVAVARKPETMA